MMNLKKNVINIISIIIIYYYRFGMMTCCWLPNPEERPSSAQVLACLQDFQKTINQFI